jgi:hypothetical protein
MINSQPNSGTNTPKDLSNNRVKKFQNGWTEEQEVLLAKWSDYASCYRWLHDRTEKQLSWSNNWITIPVIILSTITGTASVGLNSLVGDSMDAQKYAQISIGLVSLSTGILTTLGNYFRFAQNSESHRVAAVSWSKFNRLIAVELAQKPDDRMDSLDFISLCRQDLDRLIEQSPQIPDNIIASFEKEFQHQDDLNKPDICNNIEHTNVFNSSKTRMKLMVSELAMNLRHKKKMLREEILPDLDKRMKSMIDQSMKDYEEKVKQNMKKEDKFSFMTDVRKRLGEVVNSVADIHISEASPRSPTRENIVIDIIGQRKTS